MNNTHRAALILGGLSLWSAGVVCGAITATAHMGLKQRNAAQRQAVRYTAPASGSMPGEYGCVSLPPREPLGERVYIRQDEYHPERYRVMNREEYQAQLARDREEGEIAAQVLGGPGGMR